jgi:hypothetical protein
MTAFRLETFIPRTGAPGGEDAVQARIDIARDEARAAGWLEGQAAATDAHLADDTRLSSELIEALEDARLTNEAARRHVMASVAPLIRTLFTAVAPSLADAGLIGEIERLAARALDAAPEARLRLRCAPELAPRVEAVLRERGIEATVEAAPTLMPREARIHWDQGYDSLDLDACIAGIGESLARHLQPTAEEAGNDGIDHG